VVYEMTRFIAEENYTYKVVIPKIEEQLGVK
jgi:hypothetical protein